MTVSPNMWHTALPWPVWMPAGLFPSVVAAHQTLVRIGEHRRWAKSCKGECRRQWWEADSRKEGLVWGFVQVRTEFGSSVVLHFVSEPRQQGWVWTQSVPGNAHKVSFMSHLQRNKATQAPLGPPPRPVHPPHGHPTWDLPTTKQCKARQKDAVSDLRPVGHSRGGTVRAGGAGQ